MRASPRPGYRAWWQSGSARPVVVGGPPSEPAPHGRSTRLPGPSPDPECGGRRLRVGRESKNPSSQNPCSACWAVENLKQAQAVVVLITPDEVAYLRSEYSIDPNESDINPAAQARPNVLFEAGMAMGRNSDRTILVEHGTVRPFSDVAGRHVIRLDNSPSSRKELAQRLQTARCPVDLTGTDSMTVGDLSPPQLRRDSVSRSGGACHPELNRAACASTPATMTAARAAVLLRSSILERSPFST